MREAAIDTHRSTARGAGRSRSGGAPPLDDMVGEGPVSRGASRRDGITSAAIAAQRLGGGRSPGTAARGRRAPSLATRLRGRLPRIKPLKALTVATFGVALAGIVANAMVFQRGHHPSPLFGLGRSVDGAPDATQRTAAAVPAPAPPVAVEKTGTIPPVPAAAADPVPPTAAATPKSAPIHHAAAKARHDEGAKPKPSPAQAAAVPHPRPGHPATAKAAPKPEGKAEAKADPVAKLLSGEVRTAKPDAKAAPAAKPAARAEPKASAAADGAHAAKATAGVAAHPHHRVAAAAAADGAKPAAPAE